MNRIHSHAGAFCVLVLVLMRPVGWGQETTPRSEEERAALLAERDAKGEQAIAAAKRGDLKRAQKLFGEVFDIEQSVFGAAHEELLGTLNYQAQLADAANDWNGAIEYRRRAYEMGQGLYPQGDYRVRDLEFALDEARRNAKRTDEHRRLLSQSMVMDRQRDALQRQGKVAEAIVLTKQVLSIDEKVYGKEHPSYATVLNDLANLYLSMGKYARAEPLYYESKTILEKVFGKEHPSYTRSLNNLAELYKAMGEYARAEPLHLESKTISQKMYGKEHPSHAISLQNLAGLYEAMGEYARAEPLHVEANTIFKKTLSKEHPNYAISLNNLAGLYRSMGDYARAESLYLESKRIREKVHGREHPSYAIMLNNLGLLYQEMGDYPQAEPLFLESKRIREKVYGREHPSYATVLNNLALLYDSIGDYARAEPLCLESKMIREKVFGKDHPKYAIAVSTLANVYLMMGDYARAEPLYLEAKAIAETVLGKGHPNYAKCLTGLALLYRSMGDYARAEPLYVEAKTIREKILEKEHPDHAYSLAGLAELYRSMGNYARAEPLYVEAKTICEKVLGKEHPHYAASLDGLALLYQSMGDYARAEPLYRQAIEITLNHLHAAACVQSERQQLLMSQSVRHRLDNFVGCCVEGDLDPQNVIEQVVLWKGSILRRGRDLRLAASDPAIEDQFRELQSVASQIASTARSVPEPGKTDTWKKRLSALSEKMRQLEVELSRRSAAFRDAVEPINFASIRESIPAAGVLIDYLEYRGKNGRSLVASIIRREGELVLVDLGSAEQAGAAIDTWRESFGTTQDGKAAGIKLREQLLQPLLEHIEDAELILVSTDGVLGRLPLSALPGREAGSYLIEDHRLTMIPVPQLLPALVNDQDAPRLSRELLLIGDVDYGTGKDNRTKTPPKQPRRRLRPWERSAGEGAQWESLEETRAEVEFIAGIYKRLYEPDEEAVVDLRKSQASETAFLKYAPQSMFIHLATHGFFASPEVKSALSAEAVAARGQDRMFGDQREVVRGYSPGQLSGLVFAGANDPPNVDSNSNDAAPDDGILTADEIAYLPLGGTRLVVLSACETGLGEVAGGEGLLGIQRAFQVAGARSTIATLWKVNDEATRRMMEEFYTNYLDKEMSALDALREAQLWALNNRRDMPRGLVRPVKDALEKTPPSERLSPQYWAPFVLSGDWR